MIEKIKEIGRLLQTQDNACTAHPMFMVQQRFRQYGVDTSWGCDDTVWVDEEFNEADFTAEEESMDEEEREACGYQEVGYIDTWHHVQAFFTKQAADDYVRTQSHRHREQIRVYVDSAYRNPEWKLIREFLISMANQDT